MLYRLDHHATADSLSLMFHVKRGRELIVAWWINKVYHFVDFLENLVEASVFAIKFLIPMNFVLHAQPGHQDCTGEFLPKAFGSVSHLFQMLMCVLPHMFTASEPVVHDRGICESSFPWEQGWLVTEHTLERSKVGGKQSDVDNFGCTKPMGESMPNPLDSQSKMPTENNQSLCWLSLLDCWPECDTQG